MNPNKTLNLVLANMPQMEELDLRQNQKNILSFLEEQKAPILAKTISERMKLDYNTTRARLSELMAMGYIEQPNKHKPSIGSLSDKGTSNYIPGAPVCGYSIVKQGQ